MAKKHLYEFIESEPWKQNIEEAVAFRARTLHDQTASNKMYVVGDQHPSRHKQDRLAARLNISEESAWELVREGKINSININSEEGFRVSELSVQHFEKAWGSTSPIPEN